MMVVDLLPKEQQTFVLHYQSVVQAQQTIRCSVIIVNYNGCQDLEQCLTSLFQDSQPGCEIIVVDNASYDDSVTMIQTRFPQVRLIRNYINKGYAEGNNIGAKAATGEYLVFLNPDTVVERNWLSELIFGLHTNPQAGLATPRILLLQEPTMLNTCGNDSHFTGLTLCRGMGKRWDSLTQTSEVGAISGAAFAIRQSLYENLGGFDENFFMYMEDTDLSWRARLMGYETVYVPNSIVNHDYTLRFGPKKTFYQERNRYLMLFKNLKWQTLFVLLPALILAELITWGFVLTQDRKNCRNKLDAYRWIYRNWMDVLQGRRQTQIKRTVSDRALMAACTPRLNYEQTGHGLAVKVAHFIFDPFFEMWHRLALRLIR